jgi:two-component system LytT family response regulator
MALRVLLVDDEQPARERLRLLLGAHDDVAVVGEAADGEQAAEQIAELAPELVLLDIEMPGCSGIEVAASLPAPRPKIVFCTAFDEYAVDAFELHAVDYLLKPVNRARLAQALERVRRLPAEELDASIEKIGPASGNYPRRFLAKRGSKYCVVPREEVLYFASEGGLTKLQSAAGHFWISRAGIINLDAVREVVPQPGGHGEVDLRGGARLEVSRRRLKTLMGRLAES